ncbi:MAG: Magnesium chelatase, subunit ChlI, partial [uncultured Phycisphaerae bacterium]
ESPPPCHARTVEGDGLPPGVGEGRAPPQRDPQAARGRGDVPWHRRLPRERDPADRQRHPLQARPAVPRPPRAGQDAHPPPAAGTTRRVDPDPRGRRDQRRPGRADDQDRQAARGRAGRRRGDRVGPPPRPLPREAGDARRDDRRPDRRDRPREARRGAVPVRREHDALRADPAQQPRHLRDQRVARPRAAHPGGAVQRAGRARRADPGLPDPAEPGRVPRVQRQPRGLHQPRPDRDAAEGPHRLGRADALPRERRRGHRDRRAERLPRPGGHRRQRGRRRGGVGLGQRRSRGRAAVHVGGDRGGRPPGPHEPPRQPGVRRVGAHEHREHGDGRQQRRAAGGRHRREAGRPPHLRPELPRGELPREDRDDAGRGGGRRGQADQEPDRRGGEDRLRALRRRRGLREHHRAVPRQPDVPVRRRPVGRRVRRQHAGGQGPAPVGDRARQGTEARRRRRRHAGERRRVPARGLVRQQPPEQVQLEGEDVLQEV